MIKLFGHYRTNLPEREDLAIVFFPGSFPLNWVVANHSARFMAGYFATLFSCDAGEAVSHKLCEEISGSVDFIVNELVENIIKFHHDYSCEARLSLGLYEGELVIQTCNQVDPQTLPHFYQFLEEVETTGPGELLLLKMEQNATTEDDSASGLGLLMIMHDYEAKIGWRFEISDSAPPKISVVTMVRLPVPDSLQGGLKRES